METRKVNVNGNEYLFVNESGDTRYGFYHRSTLFVNDCQRATNKCNYLNRTWECYRYQTSMKGAIRQLREQRYNNLLNDFKSENGYSKMTEKRKEEFNNYLSKDKLYDEYETVYKNLDGNK